jgi:hypothetical protein
VTSNKQRRARDSPEKKRSKKNVIDEVLKQNMD